jgi:hypothetical protein
MDVLVTAVDYLQAVDKLNRIQKIRQAYERILGILSTKATVEDKATLLTLFKQTYENIKTAEKNTEQQVAILSKNTEE